MLREDNFVYGFALGVVVPVLGYLAVDAVLGTLGSLGATGSDGQAIAFKPRTLALVALCCNLLPFRAYAGLRNERSMRGVLVATGVYAAGWLWVYGVDLFRAAEA